MAAGLATGGTRGTGIKSNLIERLDLGGSQEQTTVGRRDVQDVETLRTIGAKDV